MENYEKAYLDIDKLAKKIDERIRELEKEDERKKKAREYQDHKVGENISDLDEIIKEIDRRITELEQEEKMLDLDALTEKVNVKLDELDDVKEEDLEKTIYDLSEISKTINETIKALEEKKKERKRKKAMYCDMARKQKRNKKNQIRKENSC